MIFSYLRPKENYMWQRNGRSQLKQRNPLTASKGVCPVLCFRGGRGLTCVTWRRGEPWVGSVDRPSHDAEREMGADVWGVDTKGEELGSSPRPRGIETGC